MAPLILPIPTRLSRLLLPLRDSSHLQLSTTPARLVKRPQKPYPMVLPFIDAHGYAQNPIPPEPGGPKLPWDYQQRLGLIAERKTLSKVERYGNQEAFGLRISKRSSGSDGSVREEGESLRPVRRERMSKEGDDQRPSSRERGQAERTHGVGDQGRWTYRGGSKFGLRAESRDASSRGDQMGTHSSSQGEASRSNRQLRVESGSNVEIPIIKRPDRMNPFKSYAGQYSGQRKAGPAIQSTRTYQTAPGFGLDQQDGSDVSPPRPRTLPPKQLFRPPSQSPIQTSPPSPFEEEVTSPSTTSDSAIAPSWSPTKKLTFAAMAGLKTLHQADPEKFSRVILSHRFGISTEAVRRIVKSNFRQRDADDGQLIEARPATKARKEGVNVKNLKGTKWDMSPLTAERYSPVPAIMRAYLKSSSRRPKSLDFEKDKEEKTRNDEEAS